MTGQCGVAEESSKPFLAMRCKMPVTCASPFSPCRAVRGGRWTPFSAAGVFGQIAWAAILAGWRLRRGFLRIRGSLCQRQLVARIRRRSAGRLSNNSAACGSDGVDGCPPRSSVPITFRRPRLCAWKTCHDSTGKHITLARRRSAMSTTSTRTARHGLPCGTPQPGEGAYARFRRDHQQHEVYL